MTANFEIQFSHAYQVAYAVASNSGTSSIHTALGVLEINPGDEIITTPITDMGTVIPILSQNAIPVFADINDNYTIDPKSIKQRMTKRTKAVIAVHTFGNPCDMEQIIDICKDHGVAVIEDCAQAHMTKYKDRYLGSIGDFGCFSFQESKHLTTGDGGMTITNNTQYGYKMRLFADKGVDREIRGHSAHLFHAPNYRMPELTAAIGIAQLKKVPAVVARRNHLGTMLTDLISDIEGIRPAPVTSGGMHSYWAYPLYLEEIDVETFLNKLRASGISAAAHMSQPVYRTAVHLSKRKAYGNGHCPFSCGNSIEYADGLCPKAEALSNHLVTIWLTENWSEARILKVSQQIRKIVHSMGGR
jgi:dTDP-4-amino-4,6-dideoxygalactose transaminase